MIVADSLSRCYGKGDVAVQALNNVSFRIESGEKVSVLGKSGSGKSTLLNLVAAMDSPTSGSLSVNDVQPATMTSEEKALYRLKQIGVVFQSFQLIPHRTAFQNVELPLILSGCDRKQRKSRVREMLAKVGLEKRLRHRPSQLSGGEQQRVSIARAMVHRPAVLLADEPTGNLDSGNATQVTDLMLELLDQQNATLLLITHDKALAKRISDRTVHLKDGQRIDA